MSSVPQVGFAELKKTADNRANIGGTIIGAPIVRPIVGTIYINRSLGCRLQADDETYIVAPIVGLFTLGRSSG